MYGNGGILGGVAPTRTGAPGVWRVGEIANAKAAYLWPTVQDPDFASVVLLDHLTGTAGKECFQNRGNGSPGLANTSTSSVAIPFSSTQAKFWPTSLALTASNQLVRCGGVTSHATYGFGTGDWTVEFWVYPTTTANGTNLLDMRPNGTNGLTVRIYIGASRSVRLYVNTADRITGANGGIAVNGWYHIAAARASGTTRLFINGTQTGSDYSDSNTYANANVCVGNGAGGGGGVCTGYFNDLRITKGVGRYTAGFTPPSEPFPDY